jgi:outer membrane protein OmpA-like peptidoglycan-associated protein
MAAPMVLSFITKRVHAEGLSMTGLGNLLANESGAIRNALPTGIAELIRPTTEETASPVVAQSVQAESSSLRWLLPLLALAAVIPTIFWLANRAPSVTPPQTSRITPPSGGFGTANRVAPDANRIASSSVDMVKGALVDTVLRFDTGSSKLTPASQARLNRIASTLATYPDVHATMDGYTDTVGSADSNKTLSLQRANSVISELIRKGISADRLSAEGYGQDDPIADNSTAEGRAQNRRVTVDVTQR